MKGQYPEAEALYTKALEEFPLDNSQSIIYTNRSAARFNMGDTVGALSDAERAISADGAWTKAYYRKACALEKLGRQRECFQTWQQAKLSCKNDSWLISHCVAAEAKWKRSFLTEPIADESDLIDRFRIIVDKRERLSTMAHFWNDSNKEERLVCML